MPTSTEINPHDIEAALKSVHDQKTFLNDLLAEILNWPVSTGVRDVNEISYEWSEADLRARELSKKLIAGRVLQVQLTTDQPWGIFILEFANVDVFKTDRGMTGVLRQVLRGLVKNRNKPGSLPSWQRESLLFICTHAYKHFRVAHFKAPKEDGRTARLAAFGWGPDIPARTACTFNLNHLGWPSTIAGFDQWAEAFNVEKVTKKFYGEYSHEFDALRAAVKGLGSNTEDQKMFTQTLLNRLMFLRFIERKRWLTPPGSPAGPDAHDYLKLLFAAGNYRGKSFYAGRLRKLFFEGLAIEGKQESESIGKAVFLNGGLFEETSLDEKVAEIPNEAFAPLLGPDGLFYRYNFTVQESTPLDIEVAVDPEMLGKVFEELVTGRHESGSYYTPRPVVSFMCREAIKGYLTAKTSVPALDIEALVDRHEVTGRAESHAKQILDALDSLKAVDPACGSGAYLLGLLHELVILYRLLKDSRTLYELKLRIISNSIYGVDIDKFATNIAMLRLWLSLAVDSDNPMPLPNLEFKIETGDSLTGPDPSEMPGLFREKLQRDADALISDKDEYLNCHDSSKKLKLAKIQTKQELIAKSLQAQLGEGVIDWRIHFAEVFAGKKAKFTIDNKFAFANDLPGAQGSLPMGEQRGGFDIVLANPPYISALEFARTRSKEERKNLTSAFETAKGAWDLYVPFFERGLQLLCQGGQLSFITPNKYLAATYAVALREYIYKKTSIRSIADLSMIPVFRSASVYPVLTHLTKGAADAYLVEALKPMDLDATEFDPATCRRVSIPSHLLDLLPDHIWSFLLSDRVDLLRRLLEGTVPLAETGKINATTTAAEADEFGSSLSDKQPAHGFKIVNTGTIEPYFSLWGEENLTHQKRRFLTPWLAERAISTARRDLYRKPKILFAKMAKRCEAFWDADGQFGALNSNCFYDPISTIRLGYVAAYVNSSVFMFFYSQFFGSLRMQGGYFQFQSPQLRVMPILAVHDTEQSALESLAERARHLRGEALSAIEHEIDERVAKIFNVRLADLSGASGSDNSLQGVDPTSQVIQQAEEWVADRKKDGWTKTDFAEGLRKFFKEEGGK